MALFQAEEYLERNRNTKERMTNAGIDVLLVSDPANMNYLTGYDGWSFYVHQGVIVSLDAKYPLWFGREQDSNGARLTSWLPDDCVYEIRMNMSSLAILTPCAGYRICCARKEWIRNDSVWRWMDTGLMPGCMSPF